MSEPQEIVETRGNDRVDLIAQDTSGNGKPDVWVADTDGDGKVDVTMVDLDQDGTPESIVEGDGGLPPA